MREFSVNVIGCNIVPFTLAYTGYIKRWHEGWFNDRVFELAAPQEVYNEIAGLTEECIEIMEG